MEIQVVFKNDRTVYQDLGYKVLINSLIVFFFTFSIDKQLI